MKTLLKNKRLISGLVALMLGVAILVMSLSLAWFTSEDEDTSGTITIGSLKVYTELIDLYPDDSNPNDAYPESEHYKWQLAKLWKKGSIDAFVQINLEAVLPAQAGPDVEVPPVELVIREDGIPNGAPRNDPDVMAGTHGHGARAYPLGLWMDLDGECSYAWFIGADGKYYVEMCGAGKNYANDELHIGYSILFPEDKLTNPKYNDLEEPYQFDVNLKVKGVQAFPETARIDYFGADLDAGVPPMTGEVEVIDDFITIVTPWDKTNGVPWFTMMLDHIVIVDRANEKAYDAALGIELYPDGENWSAFSAGGNGPDLAAIAKVAEALPAGAVKAALLAKYF